MNGKEQILPDPIYIYIYLCQEEDQETGATDNCDYQLFVNGKEQICVVQSAPEARAGRKIDVYRYRNAPFGLRILPRSPLTDVYT